VVTAIHLAGIRLASRLNDAGVIAEIAGAVVITAIFLVFFGPSSEHGLRILADSTNYTTGVPAQLPAYALSLLSSGAVGS
jgi:amino acid transporter